MKLRVPGYRLEDMNTDQVALAVSLYDAQPAVKATAYAILAGQPLPAQWTTNTRRWYRMKARKLLRTILFTAPLSFGLVRIDPGRITTSMTSQQLASFCDLPITRVYTLARGAPANGLPKPEWPKGRTSKGRGWRFPPTTARAFARRLLGREEEDGRRN